MNPDAGKIARRILNLIESRDYAWLDSFGAIQIDDQQKSWTQITMDEFGKIKDLRALCKAVLEKKK